MLHFSDRLLTCREVEHFKKLGDELSRGDLRLYTHLVVYLNYARARVGERTVYIRTKTSSGWEREQGIDFGVCESVKRGA